MEHHTLDVWPIPKDETPNFINEPWLIDRSLDGDGPKVKEPDTDSDNIRIYIPMDLNKRAIIRRLQEIVSRYREAAEANEMDFDVEVGRLINQIEIYDQIWFVRHMPKDRKHSAEAKELVAEFIQVLKEIPVSDSETFPYDTISELAQEYAFNAFAGMSVTHSYLSHSFREGLLLSGSGTGSISCHS